MWQERLKGLLIIIISAAVSFGLINYFVRHKDEVTNSLSQLSPQQIEKQILGAFSQGDKKKANQESSPEASLPVNLIDNQVNQLLKEIKKLPQEQLEAIKKRILGQICQEFIGQESTHEASQESSSH